MKRDSYDPEALALRAALGELAAMRAAEVEHERAPLAVTLDDGDSFAIEHPEAWSMRVIRLDLSGDG